MEFWDRFKYPTAAKFRDDHVLMFWLKHSSQQNFVHDVVYEVAGPEGERTKVKYVARRQRGNRTLLIFRRLRRLARVGA